MCTAPALQQFMGAVPAGTGVARPERIGPGIDKPAGQEDLALDSAGYRLKPARNPFQDAKPTVPIPTFRPYTLGETERMPTYQSSLGSGGPREGEYRPEVPYIHEDQSDTGWLPPPTLPEGMSIPGESILRFWDKFPNAGPQVRDDVDQPYFFLGLPRKARTIPLQQDMNQGLEWPVSLTNPKPSRT